HRFRERTDYVLAGFVERLPVEELEVATQLDARIELDGARCGDRSRGAGVHELLQRRDAGDLQEARPVLVHEQPRLAAQGGREDPERGDGQGGVEVDALTIDRRCGDDVVELDR